MEDGGRINDMRRDAHFADGGDIKAPVLITPANGKIVIERCPADFHVIKEVFDSPGYKSSFHLIIGTLSM